MRILTFRLCGELYGIEVSAVREINRNITYTEVPTADPQIIGLYNMRGQVVTLFDLAYMLGHEITRNAIDYCIILRSSKDCGDIIGICTEYTDDVIYIDDAMCKKPPANVEQKIRENLLGVYETENELLLIIDHAKLFGGNTKYEKENEKCSSTT